MIAIKIDHFYNILPNQSRIEGTRNDFSPSFQGCDCIDDVVKNISLRNATANELPFVWCATWQHREKHGLLLNRTWTNRMWRHINIGAYNEFYHLILLYVIEDSVKSKSNLYSNVIHPKMKKNGRFLPFWSLWRHWWRHIPLFISKMYCALN